MENDKTGSVPLEEYHVGSELRAFIDSFLTLVPDNGMYGKCSGIFEVKVPFKDGGFMVVSVVNKHPAEVSWYLFCKEGFVENHSRRNTIAGDYETVLKGTDGTHIKTYTARILQEKI